MLVPPAMTAILSSPTNRVQGFLGAGHVCTVMGYEEYEPLAEQFQIPIVVTGFEPLDLLEGVYRCVSMLEAGNVGVREPVRPGRPPRGQPRGSRTGRRGVRCERPQMARHRHDPAKRAIRLRPEYAEYDAETRFSVQQLQVLESDGCISGLILQGIRKPHECPAFGKNLHAGTSARRDDGLLRGGLCRLLQLRSLPPIDSGPGLKSRSDGPSHERSPGCRFRPHELSAAARPITITCSWGTAAAAI